MKINVLAKRYIVWYRVDVVRCFYKEYSMKSSFNEIASASEEVLSRAKAGILSAAEEAVASQSAKTTVGGLRVVSREAVVRVKDTLASQLISSANAFQEDCKALDLSLLKVGVKPIVILPTSMWDKITKEAGLFTFYSNTGVVRTSRQFDNVPFKIASDIDSFTSKEDGVIATILAIITFIGGIYFTMRYVTPPDMHPVLSFLCGFGVGALSAVFVSTYLFKFISSLVMKLLVSFKVNSEIRKAGGLYHFLWPNQKEDDFSGQYTASSHVAVEFPVPPQEVQETLYRLKDSILERTLLLTVDPRAITFVSDPIQTMVRNGLKQHKAIKVARLAAERSDPIVTVSGPAGLATAVIAQFGDFPIEKEAVAKALEQFSLV